MIPKNMTEKNMTEEKDAKATDTPEIVTPPKTRKPRRGIDDLIAEAQERVKKLRETQEKRLAKAGGNAKAVLLGKALIELHEITNDKLLNVTTKDEAKAFLSDMLSQKAYATIPVGTPPEGF